MTQTSGTEDRCLVITDPRPGIVVELVPGCQVGVTFRRGLGDSRWRIADLPGYLLPLATSGHAFQFLVFGGDAVEARPLRLERFHPDREFVHEVCELLVVPVTSDDARTSRPASRRTA